MSEILVAAAGGHLQLEYGCHLQPICIIRCVLCQQILLSGSMPPKMVTKEALLRSEIFI